MLSQRNEQLLDNFYNAQNALISRVLTIPTSSTGEIGGMELLKDVKAELPKSIIRNKQLYEALFTMLQVHPCYLINWITKTTVNRQPKEVLHIL